MSNLPRVMAIHDMSGFGKCSLTVVLPIVSACEVEVCPIPTALLSTSTNFEGFTLFDFTQNIEGYINHWLELGLKFDALYSGFLGSVQQIDYIKKMVKMFRPQKVIIDPVMGDDGVIYKTYTPEMCEDMRSLVACADIATPNLTEACALTGIPYKDADVSREGIKLICERIVELGAKNVIITGIERDDRLCNCCMEDGNYFERDIELLPYRMHGTGDMFSSVLTGGVLTGHTLTQSVDSAAKFVYAVMRESKKRGGGTCFEPFLHVLSGGIIE